MTMLPDDGSMLDDLPGDGGLPLETPRHGFQGDRGAVLRKPDIPRGLSICISRETGARGATIGKRIGRKLGWPVYDQELLEFMAQEGSAGAGNQEAPDDLADWVEQRLQKLLREQTLSQHPSIIRLARVILLLAARGPAVFIGRGAGFLLPASHTLHVRILAPLLDRVAYMGQSLRLSQTEAADHVRSRDARRAEFLATHFHRKPDDVHQYDLMLNSSRLGEEGTAALICQAILLRADREPPEEMTA